MSASAAPARSRPPCFGASVLPWVRAGPAVRSRSRYHSADQVDQVRGRRMERRGSGGGGPIKEGGGGTRAAGGAGGGLRGGGSRRGGGVCDHPAPGPRASLARP